VRNWLRWRLFEAQILTRWALRWEHSRPIGAVGGVEIRLHNVWLSFLLFDALSSSLTVPHKLPGWPLLAYPLLMLLAVLGIHVGVILPHELAHAAVAKVAGRRVERIVIYGPGGCMMSQPRPDEPWWVLALVAGIGPLTNLAFALCWCAAVRQFGSVGDALQTPLGLLSFIMLWINVLAVAINSIPMPLVDGGLVAAAFRARKARCTTAPVA